MSIQESYRIIDKLDDQQRRKFGLIFLVEDKSTGKKAVMKVVNKNDSNQHISARLVHESKFTFDIDGLPNILDFYESENETILIRDYVEGVPLDQYWSQLKRKEKLPFLIRLTERLTPLFKELETRNIVHCDIKPSNILIEGNSEKIHLIDFGLAIDKNRLEGRKILFPLGFAAPELLLNHLDVVNTTTDIYAYGISIWRLFTGKLPLTHPNPSIFTNLQLTHPLPNDSTFPKGLYPVLAKMTHKHRFDLPPNKMNADEVKRLLQKAMSHRYQNLDDLIVDLKEINNSRRFLPKKIFSKS